MNLEFEAAKDLAAIVAKDTTARVKMQEGCRVPHTNGREIILPPLRPEWGSDSAEAIGWWSSFVHECYHHKEDNMQDFKMAKGRKINTSSPFGFLLNIVIDHNIEHKEYGKLEGIDYWMDKSYSKIISDIFLNFGTYPDNTFKALLAFDFHCRAQWSGIPDLHFENELGDCRKVYDNLIEHCKDDYLTPREGGEPNYRMACKMKYFLTMDDLPDELPNGGYDETSEPSESMDVSEEEGKELEKIMKRYYDDSGLDSLSDNHDLTAAKEAADSVYDPKYSDTSDYIPAKMDILNSKDSVRSDSRTVARVHEGLDYCLSDKVRNILKVLSQVKWNGGHKRGKIHKKAIARVTAGSDTIFRQREQKIVLDTAVTILLDSSGSMAGTRYYNGIKACAMLNDALSKIGIPIEILGFTQDYDREGHNKHYIHRAFGESVTNDELIERMSGVDLENNDDGASIMWAHSRLIRQKNKRKILIVLSDGMPACRQRAAFPFTCKVVKEIEEGSPVEIYGIGIQTDSVKKIYSDWSVIHKPDQLEEVLLTTVKNKIINQ